MADYIIDRWQFLQSWTRLKTNDTILVKAEGTMDNVTIPHDVASVTLEEGAYLTEGLKTGKELTILGPVYEYFSGSPSFYLTLDFTERTTEEPIMISDWSLLNVNAFVSLCVRPSQGEGTYRLIGKAADFSKTVTVSYPGDIQLGTFSLDAPEFDYGIKHYTLSLNEADELCMTVSTSIPEGANILEGTQIFQRGPYF